MALISKVEETLSKLFTAERKLQEEKAEAEKKDVTARQVRIILVIAFVMRLMMILFVMMRMGGILRSILIYNHIVVYKYIYNITIPVLT